MEAEKNAARGISGTFVAVGQLAALGLHPVDPRHGAPRAFGPRALREAPWRTLVRWQPDFTAIQILAKAKALPARHLLQLWPHMAAVKQSRTGLQRRPAPRAGSDGLEVGKRGRALAGVRVVVFGTPNHSAAAKAVPSLI